jgi:hypothetical protein
MEAKSKFFAVLFVLYRHDDDGAGIVVKSGMTTLLYKNHGPELKQIVWAKIAEDFRDWQIQNINIGEITEDNIGALYLSDIHLSLQSSIVPFAL